MSVLSDKVYDLLNDLFKYNIIVPEYYINYKGSKLFFDFYIKDLSILFEVQGRQHSEFTKHFHKDSSGFINSKKRDNLKLRYVEENKIPFVVVNYNERISKGLLLGKIIEAQSEVLNNDRNNNVG